MKKIIKWLTNKSKIVRVIRYIYRGAYVMQAVLISARQSLVQTQPVGEQNEKFNKIIESLDTCNAFLEGVTAALEKVLGWVGAEELEANNTAAIELLSQASVNEAAAEAVGTDGETVRGNAEVSAGTMLFALQNINGKLFEAADD